MLEKKSGLANAPRSLDADKSVTPVYAAIERAVPLAVGLAYSTLGYLENLACLVPVHVELRYMLRFRFTTFCQNLWFALPKILAELWF